ncbi:MAG: type II secretion system F family protein [Planktotalea sp.]|uniref:type II secretion system F family protein n=1 Tax=Planktotalea sp. TaxID=2029877 RepID=UPI003C745D7C
MFDHATLLAWMAFTALGAVLLGAGVLLHLEAKRVQRMNRIMRAAGKLSAAELLHQSNEPGASKNLLATLKRAATKTGERFTVILGGEARATADDLASAGYTGRDAVLIFAFLKTLVPLIVSVVGLGLVLLRAMNGQSIFMPLIVTVAAALALSKAVDFFVSHKRSTRLATIRRGVPDMLELLVITSEAGLGPQPALHRVARELRRSHPVMANEVLSMVSEMRMTNDRRMAYEKLNIRVPLPEIGVFTQTLHQSDTYGTPFSKAMRTLIADQRTDRLMRIEEKAARLPVIMTMPLIFCIMPAVFIVLVGPAVLSVLDNIIGGG